MSEVEVIEAVVQVGAQVTPYLRCGRGTPVVILAEDAHERSRLVRLLGEQFCAVAPAPPGRRRLGLWLREVIDGLGLAEPALVVAAGWAGGAALASEAGLPALLQLDGDDRAMLRALEGLGRG